MFDIAEAYAEWKSSPETFSGSPVIDPGQLLETLATQPEAIFDDEVWQSILACACPLDNAAAAHEWLGIILENMRMWSRRAELREEADCTPAALREAQTKYLFLGRMHESRLIHSTGNWQPSLMALLDAEALVLASRFDELVPASATAERASLARLYMEPALELLQRTDICDNQQLVHRVIKLVCLGVTSQRQQELALPHLVQLVKFSDHSTKVVIQLLQALTQEYNHTALAANVFREVAQHASEQEGAPSATNLSTAAKSLAKFLNMFVTAMPELVVSQLPAALPLFESPAPQVRQSALDLAGIIMQYLLTQVIITDGNGTAHMQAVRDLLALISPHVNDVHHFCRVRALQTLAVVATDARLEQFRPEVMGLGVQKMKDRALLVRKSAIRLVKSLIETHPFRAFDGRLDRSRWLRREAKIARNISECEADVRESSGTEAQVNAEMGANSSTNEGIISCGTTEQEERLSKLYELLKYHRCALAFISQCDDSIATARALLQSRSKTDILDAMDLLVSADLMGIDSSRTGIRQIVHLVWAKADNDEEQMVSKMAVSHYCDLFMNPPPDLSPRDAYMHVAFSLLALTTDATHGELTSLERLLGMAMAADRLAPGVVTALYAIYTGMGPKSESEKTVTKRGAAAILAMVSAYDHNIALGGMSYIQSSFSTEDLDLAKWSCLLARRSVPPGAAGSLSLDHEIFVDLVSLLRRPADSETWFGFAREAMRAIGSLCESPDKLFTQLIRDISCEVFKNEPTGSEQRLFGQLIFLVGEAALNILLQLEWCENKFKHQRASTNSDGGSGEAPGEGANNAAAGGEDEEMIGGGNTVEDSFIDALREIRERELLYSDRSLLKMWGSLIADLCRDELQGSARHDTFTAIAATNSLAKFMCVSSRYGEEHFSLLLELMDTHPNTVVRSNLVVAMADVAVSFNRLVDQHTEFLYARLTDPDKAVQRTCIVALTFLILAGQIKVKGQLVEMAKAVISEDTKIGNLATMFFRELSTKEHAIYNSFLDILSGLAADPDITEPQVLKILKFLAKFIDKDRQVKALTEKLVSRLPRAESSRQWSGCVQVLRSLPGKLTDEVKAAIEKGYQPMPGEQIQESMILDELASEGALELQTALGDMSIVATTT